MVGGVFLSPERCECNPVSPSNIKAVARVVKAAKTNQKPTGLSARLRTFDHIIPGPPYKISPRNTLSKTIRNKNPLELKGKVHMAKGLYCDDDDRNRMPKKDAATKNPNTNPATRNGKGTLMLNKLRISFP